MTNEGRGARVGLGQISHMEPKEIWPHEALDFTPWLREHPKLLAEALRLDLEISDAELPVGGFNVDLVGNDLTNHRRLLVENQLDQTDHTHLGQLLTYAAGLDAATIVWISPQFREEHRQALDWLNAHTDEQVDVFGLELEVIRIGDSEPAPNLRPVATPNEWASGARRAASGTEPSELAQARRSFFERALTELKRRKPGVTNATHPGPGNWFSMSAGRSGFWFSWVFSGDRRLRVDLYIDTPEGESNLAYSEALAAQQQQLEEQVQVPLEWNAVEGRRAVRISAAHELGNLAPANYDQLLEWAVTTMLAFNTVFRPLVRGLRAVRSLPDVGEPVPVESAQEPID